MVQDIVVMIVCYNHKPFIVQVTDSMSLMFMHLIVAHIKHQCRKTTLISLTKHNSLFLKGFKPCFRHGK
jgi:hypothetical protein